VKRSFKKAVTVIIIFLFFAVDPSFQVYGSTSVCLSPWILSDSNPMRSLDADACEKAKPGAVGKGDPLNRLLRGKEALPPIVFGDPKIIEEIVLKVKESVKLAIKAYIRSERKDELSVSDRERGDKALANMLDFFENTEKRLYFFNSIVEGEGNYLLAFSHGNDIGLDPEFIRFLYNKSPLRLAQLIFHECIPEHIKEEDGYLDLSDHSYIYNVIQSRIFGKFAEHQTTAGIIIDKIKHGD